MNILFFLTPKSEVIYIESSITIRKALMQIQSHSYTSIPIISENGEYIGAINEGDFLRYFKNITTGEPDPDLSENVLKIPRAISYDPVSINSNIEDLISKVTNQNFVPVVDDNKKFIGIITRKDVIQYVYKKLKANIDNDN
ncbi:MAG: CBS domain-containing protein [Lachnospiraceae bacterium]|nr:CBS domain-containing protein [Lachnospiraceae bacterium]